MHDVKKNEVKFVQMSGLDQNVCVSYLLII